MKKQYLIMSVISAMAITVGLSSRNYVTAAPSSISRQSTTSAGAQANSYSDSLNYDAGNGTYVVFRSAATNLVSGDTNGKNDIFRKNVITGSIERVSVADDESEGNGHVGAWSSVSYDGRYVLFSTSATNMVSGDMNGKQDVFLRDTINGTTVLASANSSGGFPNDHSGSAVISKDGRFIVFASGATDIVSGDTNGFADIFVRDLALNTIKRISMNGATQADGTSFGPSMSCDGRYIAFGSYATNLVSGDTNGYTDFFVYDQMGGILKNFTKSGNGNTGGSPRMTCNGKHISLYSYANNLVSGDTNAKPDAFLYDREADSFGLVSVADDESLGNNDSYGGTVSEDGRYFAFYSLATNLVSSDSSDIFTDIYLRDRTNGTTTKMSMQPGGTMANAYSQTPLISGDGKYITFNSDATNLVTGDTNASPDIFRVDTGNTANPCAEE